MAELAEVGYPVSTGSDWRPAEQVEPVASKDAELEIGLQWRPHDQQFNASLAFDGPADQEPRRQLVDQPVHVDLPRLRQLTANAEQYGTALTEMLFAVEEIGDFYRLARTTAGADDTPIHLRLLVDPSAPNDYHRVRWELLRDPEDGARVDTRRNVMFSRYLSSSDWTLSTPPPRPTGSTCCTSSATAPSPTGTRGCGSRLPTARRRWSTASSWWTGSTGSPAGPRWPSSARASPPPPVPSPP